jgi:hypothetical protein
VRLTNKPRAILTLTANRVQEIYVRLPWFQIRNRKQRQVQAIGFYSLKLSAQENF